MRARLAKLIRYFATTLASIDDTSDDVATFVIQGIG
jgi:hypothetical protein